MCVARTHLDEPTKHASLYTGSITGVAVRQLCHSSARCMFQFLYHRPVAEDHHAQVTALALAMAAHLPMDKTLPNEYSTAKLVNWNDMRNVSDCRHQKQHEQVKCVGQEHSAQFSSKQGVHRLGTDLTVHNVEYYYCMVLLTSAMSTLAYLRWQLLVSILIGRSGGPASTIKTCTRFSS